MPLAYARAAPIGLYGDLVLRVWGTTARFRNITITRYGTILRAYTLMLGLPPGVTLNTSHMPSTPWPCTAHTIA